MQFFRYLYHNVPDLASMWMSPDFLCALAATVFPFNIRPYSEMVGKGEENVRTGISLFQWLADFFWQSFKLLNKLQFHNFIHHLLHYCLVSPAPHSFLLLSPKITVNSTSFSHSPYSCKSLVSNFPFQIVDSFLILHDASCVVIKCSFPLR